MLEEKNNQHLEKQKLVIKQLSSSFRNGRVGHAYLFDGEQGTGKKEAALFFTKLLLCGNPEKTVPCETCHSCRRITSGNHPNVTTIRADGQDIKKEQMSGLIFNMTKKGYESGRKIYIIYKADRMNSAAANTLLKFLEEPEGDVTAILLTDSYQSILPTIQSRCQRISFLSPSREAMIMELVEKGVTISMAATVTMVTADIDDAFQLARDDQFAHMRKTVLKLVEASDRHVHEALLFIQSEWSPLFKEKEEAERGLDLLLYAFRDIVSSKAGLQSTLAFPDQQEFFKSFSMKMTYSRLSANMEAILQAKKRLRGNMNRMLLMEQLVLSMQEGLLVV
ncbi:DNA polymerase III subunit delta' [Sporosarcina limicola]|uniref:DNA polymerase III subunit delta' n=1 Tax=Sporosarcina limicola TaxID=34101 RepID=A0A927RG59_9BACL|nr:DNA polymerase III subunit delta' [Sporosarcina limicola]MBE1556202.1 DNA polymerase-3 subunit delta' [Sporosarcina limicola]